MPDVPPDLKYATLLACPTCGKRTWIADGEHAPAHMHMWKPIASMYYNRPDPD